MVCRLLMFQNGNLKCQKKLKRLQPPHPLTLTAYPTPGKDVPSFFIIKKTAKDVKEIVYMPWTTILERSGKKKRKP